ncbi:uncharacterized protein L969DRAFT_79533 [Mixia osmundae IAM 14324]|uniref:Uncharacterized protein n=1 Tax=Mixia osmundae (strain CBS 9802 / IAM 14324 / JCM 22182 / KY 12970) TaxID=764103 RepID=G7E1E9_MIXOS|nr:uncharacterized protein L969DRAFT_79533 [Mixia osmundae IAM 14324]KEI36613.1 hypothetical protein L969DRAFT_79533 [Mixia osmundae IAM 14324]GAA96659.1 hypothetical protein E5Q_03330 [Mixia osmundae IAM 14324]
MNALSKQFGLDAVHRILLHAHRVTFDEWVRGPTKARQERMTKQTKYIRKAQLRLRSDERALLERAKVHNDMA